MKKLLSIASLSLLAASLPAQLLPGNLALVRIGADGQTLANTGNSMFLEQYTTAGGFVNALAIPDAGASAMIASGTATSEGALSLSPNGPNGQFLAIGGYNTNRPYSASLTSSSATAVPRGVGVISPQGTYTLASTTTTFLSGNNIRGGFTDGLGNTWSVGATTANGISYLGTGTPAIVLGVNARLLNNVNGDLYYATGSGTSGIYSFAGGGFPTTTTAQQVVIATGAGSSPYDFSFSLDGMAAYIADDRSTGPGGVQRWDFVSGAWTLSYTLGTGTTNIGARGLAVDWSGTDPIIYATTGEGTTNRLISIVDTGATSTPTTLATAGLGTVFRGLEWAPIPEPSSAALLGLGLAALLGLRRKA